MSTISDLQVLKNTLINDPSTAEGAQSSIDPTLVEAAIIQTALNGSSGGGGTSPSAADIGTAVDAALKATPQPVTVPLVASASIGLVTTTPPGSSYTVLPAGACTEVLITNLDITAVDLEIRRGGSGLALLLPFGTSMLLEGLVNSSDLQVRRADLSSTPTQVRFERRTR
jgi:hypothetical protein